MANESAAQRARRRAPAASTTITSAARKGCGSHQRLTHNDYSRAAGCGGRRFESDPSCVSASGSAADARFFFDFFEFFFFSEERPTRTWRASRRPAGRRRRLPEDGDGGDEPLVGRHLLQKRRRRPWPASLKTPCRSTPSSISLHWDMVLRRGPRFSSSSSRSPSSASKSRPRGGFGAIVGACRAARALREGSVAAAASPSAAASGDDGQPSAPPPALDRDGSRIVLLWPVPTRFLDDSREHSVHLDRFCTHLRRMLIRRRRAVTILNKINLNRRQRPIPLPVDGRARDHF